MELSVWIGVILANVLSIVYFFKNLLFKGAPKLYSVPFGVAERNEGIPRRNAENKELLVAPSPDVTTLYELDMWAAKKFAGFPCVGSRKLVKLHKQETEVDKIVDGVKKKEKRTWTFFEMGPFQWESFSMAFERVKNISRGLGSLGLKPRDSKAAIYAPTSPQWFYFAHACYAQNIPVATMYANLGEEAVVFALQDTKAEVVLTNAELLPGLKKMLPKLPNLRTIVFFEEATPEVLGSFGDSKVTVLPFESLEQKGKENPTIEMNPPKPDDLAFIMYTSGSTGVPKGVMITHANLTAIVSSASKVADLNSRDVYIAYLPLAHVLELVLQTTMVFCGISLGFANPRTLTPENMKNCKGDIAELKPTLMAGVPVIWSKVMKGITTKVNQQSALKQKVFWGAFNLKKKLWDMGMDTPIIDKLIFGPVAQQFGGRLRIVLSGGAPMSAETQTFLRMVLSCPVIQGYGLTETCGASTLLPFEHRATERVGRPLPCCEIKLVDVPDMKYFSTNKYPQGEVHIRGPSVTVGYWNNPEKTAEDYKNGWFATGDIGQWFPDGTLSIIDRKKNLVKLSHGEYIALEKLESKFSSSKYVDNICVYADSQCDFPVALIVPNRKAVEEWANSKGIHDTFEHLLNRDDLRSVVLASLSEVAKVSNLKGIEIVQGVYLVHEEWTPENGMLTAAMKIKRQDINAKFKSELQQMLNK